MNERPGHGLDEYLALVNQIPEKVDVKVTKENQADFDRRVRESIDRQHRRSLMSQS